MTFCVEIETPLLDVSDIATAALFDVHRVTEAVIEAVLASEGCRTDVEVGVLVTDSERVRRLNRDFRQRDEETDVLSFPNVDFGAEIPGTAFDPDSGLLPLGDIVMAAERVRGQAEAYGHSLEREYAFLLAHSMLHLLGYDHREAEEARVMEEKQERVLGQLGIVR
jgi:probable rRNA maturation factor